MNYYIRKFFVIYLVIFIYFFAWIECITFTFNVLYYFSVRVLTNSYIKSNSVCAQYIEIRVRFNRSTTKFYISKDFYVAIVRNNNEFQLKTYLNITYNFHIEFLNILYILIILFFIFLFFELINSLTNNCVYIQLTNRYVI